MTTDIELDDDYKTINSFSGVLDGHGHSIYIHKDTPLFKSISNALLRNIKVVATDTFAFRAKDSIFKDIHFDL